MPECSLYVLSPRTQLVCPIPYVMLNLILTVHSVPDQRNVTLVAQGRNLLNEEAREASSRHGIP